MKVTVVFGCLLAMASAVVDQEILGHLREMMKRRVERCVKSENAPSDDYDVVVKRIVPETHEGKCVFFCLHKMMDIQKKDGTVDLPGSLEAVQIMESLDEEFHAKLVKLLQTCSDTNTVPFDSDPCIYAVGLEQCAWRMSEELNMPELRLVDDRR